MSIYLGILIFDILLVFLANILPKKKICTICLLAAFVLPLILVCSLKSKNVGLDTNSYYDAYSRVLDPSIPSWMYQDDKGFVFLETIFKRLNAPYFVFLLFIYLIIFGGLALFSYKKSKNPIYVLFFMTYFGILGFSLSALRQALAIGFLMIGFAFFNEKKKISIISPLIFTLIAMSIHKTSFFILPVAILLFLKFNKKAFTYFTLCMLTLCVISPFIYSSVITIIGSNYYPSLMPSSWTLIVNILFLILTFILTNKKVLRFLEEKFTICEDSKLLKSISFINVDDNDPNNVSYTTTVAYILYPILILSVGVYAVIFARIIYFLIPFTALFVVNLINKKELHLFSKTTLNVLLITFLVIYFIVSVLIKDPLSVAHYEFGPMI